MENIQVKDFIGDQQIIDKLKHPQNVCIMVLGGTDTGKTTLVRCLADLLSEHYETGIVDLDMGQSRLGPPTTIAWGKLKGGFSKWEDIEISDFYFTGSLSPPGNLLPVIVGGKMITEKAKKRCKKIIIDTTGLIAEPYGRVLKQYKIDIISPQVVIGLERENELSPILHPYKAQKYPVIIKIPVPPSVCQKSPEFRLEYRQLCFSSYFKSGRLIKVDTKKVAIRFTRERVPFISEKLLGRIVSFRDEFHRDLALGIIEEVEVSEKKLVILTPLNSSIKFTTIVVGMVNIKNYQDL